MRRFVTVFCTFMIFFSCFYYNTTNTLASESPSALYSKSAVLMDGKNQRILFGKNENEKLPMASTTKIMTCLYALEQGNLSDIVTFSENAAAAPKVHLGARAGDRFLLSDLLYALMLESYNDAAIAVAEHISGSVESFCEEMTQQARNYGCYHTSFETPNGLDSKNHYTTSSDLAILTCHALQNKQFRSIIREPSYSIKELNSGRLYSLSNKDAFLTSFPDAIGVKTGYTSGAGYCFVGAVEKEDRLLISVVLGSGWYPNRSWKWKDTKKLMEYGLEEFEPRTVSLSGELPARLPVIDGQTSSCRLSVPDSVTLLAGKEEEITCVTDLPALLDAPIEKGETLGTVSLYTGKKLYRTWPVTAQNAVQKIDYKYCLKKLLERLLLSSNQGII